MSIFKENWIREETIVCKTNNRQLGHTDGTTGKENGTEECKERKKINLSELIDSGMKNVDIILIACNHVTGARLSI